MGSELNNRGRPIAILSVEDNAADRTFITEILKGSSKPHILSFAFDGEAAIGLLQNLLSQTNARLPDLILLDMNLPKKDGIEVLQEIRREERLNDTPVIILTTSSSQSDRYVCRSYRANGFITKPIDLKQFLEVTIAIERAVQSWSGGQWIELTIVQ